MDGKVIYYYIASSNQKGKNTAYASNGRCKGGRRHIFKGMDKEPIKKRKIEQKNKNKKKNNNKRR